ncbi:hypothetical protein T484DRAFT_2812163 [Baffinella frigidus]|nr:hypothetical protein T484DRAFT_2812163 [Cryptophyta sp. CCMP2293]
MECRMQVIALSKERIVQNQSQGHAQRHLLQEIMQAMRTFHGARMSKISQARAGLITGEKVREKVPSERRPARELENHVRDLGARRYVKKQVPLFGGTQQPLKPSEAASREIEREDAHRITLAAVLSPRVDALRLPRLTRHRDRDPLHLEDSFGSEQRPAAPSLLFPGGRARRSEASGLRIPVEVMAQLRKLDARPGAHTQLRTPRTARSIFPPDTSQGPVPSLVRKGATAISHRPQVTSPSQNVQYRPFMYCTHPKSIVQVLQV